MAGSGKTRQAVGPHGEILPPPLTAGLDPDEALKEMVGEELFEQMPAAERAAFYGDAAIYAHQKRLEQVFAGQTDGIEGGAELYDAAMAGATISLRPLGYERVQYRTFAPVLHRLPDGRWRVGLPGERLPGERLPSERLPSERSEGKTQVLDETDGRLAYLAARTLYVQWAEAEAE